MIPPVTYEEFTRQLGKAGLSIRDFAELMHMNRRSLSNRAGALQVPSHWAVIAVLLGEMRESGLDYHPVLGRLDLAPKRPRGAGVPGRFGGNPQVELALAGPTESSPAGAETGSPDAESMG